MLLAPSRNDDDDGTGVEDSPTGITVEPPSDSNQGVTGSMERNDLSMENMALANLLEQKNLVLSTSRVSLAASGGSKKTLAGGMDPSLIKRAAWNNQIEFLMTAVSFAVGLGNVWRFPYLCHKNGGGGFLVPYVGMLALLGLPLFFMELAFGQFASLGPTGIWTVNMIGKGVGFAMVTVTALIALYYNVLIAQILMYFVVSFQSSLPWVTCGNDWNSPCCAETAKELEAVVNDTALTTTPSNVFDGDDLPINCTGYKHPDKHVGSPAEEYYFNRILQMGPGGIDNTGGLNLWLTLALFCAWLLTFLALLKGAKSLGKFSYFTAIYPYIMLTILLVKSCMLPGAYNGVMYFLTPQFDRLADPRVWVDAGTQIFFSLSVAGGGLIAIGSFNDFKNDCLRDALLVPIINCATSIFAGFVVFAILGYMAHLKDSTVEKVVVGGPGLVFVAYPEALATLPVAPLWSVLFFLMMLSLGFGSELSLVETFLAAFLDELPHKIDTKPKRYAFRAIACTVFFLLGLPMCTQAGVSWFTLMDYSVSGAPLLVCAFIELMMIMYIYGYKHFEEDIFMMIGRNPPVIYKYLWKYVGPVLLAVLTVASLATASLPTQEVFGEHIDFPGWALALSICISLFPLVIIIGWGFKYFCGRGGKELLRDMLLPTQTWGPRQPENRFGRYAPIPKAEDRGEVPAGITLTIAKKAKDTPAATEETERLAEDQV